MREILIEYKGRRVSTQIKTAWDELDLSDLRCVVEFFVGNSQRLFEKVKDETGQVVHKIVNAELMGFVMGALTIKFWNIGPKLLRELPGAELDRLTEGVMPAKFILEGNKLTKCPIRWVYRGGRFLFGPGDNWSTIDFEEYIYADKKWADFAESKDVKDLDMMCAILFRGWRPFYGWRNNPLDRRRVFNPQVVECRLYAMGKLSYVDKYCMFLWWEGCRNKQAGIYKRVFEGGTGGKGGNGSMLDVMMALSGDIFGGYEQTKRVNIKVVFARMKQKLLEADEREG